MSHLDLFVCDERIAELEVRLTAVKNKHGQLHRDELLNLIEETLAEWRRRREILVQIAGRPYASK